MAKCVFVVAAHPDDEALGCGGVMARHASEGAAVHVLFIADGVKSRATGDDANIVRRVNQCRAAANALGAIDPQFLDFEDQRLDQVSLLDIIKPIEAMAGRINPDVVYTHHSGDLNADHRIVNQAVMTAFRPIPGQPVKRIYGFEVLSSTEWAFGTTQAPFFPNRFVDITGTFERKMSALRCYDEEMRGFPHSRSYDAITALAKLRGAQVGLHYAEAFTVIREVD